ncbi:MAG: anti-sigma F factor antagonist [Senegalia sp. (in: firmicutes)]|uniref:anti-sigma F factor antagonist n=1 Tax=Senegalia sp. (in: firmicutes) TaxID=1924098 RepID=UPI003F9D47E5
MNINFTNNKNTLFVDVNGELDHHNAKKIREKIDALFSQVGYKNISINLKGLNFMDSSGIGLIMGRYKLTNELGGKLFLTNVNPRVSKILEMSGIYKLVEVYDTEDEVLEHL